MEENKKQEIGGILGIALLLQEKLGSKSSVEMGIIGVDGKYTKQFDVPNPKKLQLKTELQKICEIVSPIGKLVYINQSCDIIDVLDKDGKPHSLLKMREAEEGKELVLSDISEYGGFLTETDIDEILNS